MGGFDDILGFFKSLRRSREVFDNVCKLHADLFMKRVHGIKVPPSMQRFLRQAHDSEECDMAADAANTVEAYGCIEAEPLAPTANPCLLTAPILAGEHAN